MKPVLSKNEKWRQSPANAINCKNYFSV